MSLCPITLKHQFACISTPQIIIKYSKNLNKQLQTSKYLTKTPSQPLSSPSLTLTKQFCKRLETYQIILKIPWKNIDRASAGVKGLLSKQGSPQCQKRFSNSLLQHFWTFFLIPLPIIRLNTANRKLLSKRKQNAFLKDFWTFSPLPRSLFNHLSKVVHSSEWKWSHFIHI